MKKHFVNLIICILVFTGFSSAAHSKGDMNSETVISPLVRISEREREIVLNRSAKKNYATVKTDKGPASVSDRKLPQKSSRSYMKMNSRLFQELKRRVKNRGVTAVSDFPLYEDTAVTITDIQEIETFADKTVVYHGDKKIERALNSRWRFPFCTEYYIPRHTVVILAMLRDGSTVGWGNTDVICKNTGGASNYQGYSSMYVNGEILAHELGHVFGSGHTFNYDPPIEECTIMGYCNAQDNFVFHERVIETFNSLHSVETDSCVPLTNPYTSTCNAPEAEVAGKTDSSIALSWSNTGAADYTVQYREFNVMNFDWQTAEEGLNNTGYTLSGLKTDTAYAVRVYSICPDGSQPYDTVIETTGETQTVCSVPEVTVTGRTDSSITLSWSDTGALNYRVQYETSYQDTSFWRIVHRLTDTGYTISDLQPDTTYKIYVTSICHDGSQPSAFLTAATIGDQVTCTAPEITESETTENSITLSWTDTGADSYKVEYKTSGASVWQTAGSALTATSYTLSGLASDTSYDVRVYSICADGSEPYDTVAATTDETGISCEAPTINVSATSAGSISLSWNDAGADSYRVYYKQGSGSWNNPASGLTVTSYVIDGLNENTAYDIAVVSVCADGSQEYNIITATTDDSGSGGLMTANWLFNSDLLDYSGNNDLSSANAPVFSADRAEGSHAAELNGADDCFYADLNQSFNSDFTWSAFIKTGDDGTVMAKAPLTGDWARGGKSLFVSSGRLQFDVGWIGDMDSGISVSDGQWHHVAVTAQINSGSTADTVRLYVDGQLKATKNGWSIDTYSEDSMVVKIGCTNNDFPSVPYFDGLIDDVRIYDRVLDGDEIAGMQ